MTETSVARRVLEAFGRAGVRHAFGLPGVHNLAFWRDAGPGTPEIVGVRHEQTAVYAADGLARATGGLGVALTTTGPGAANAAGAFGEAAAAGSPVVLVASEVSTALRRPGTVRGLLHESRDQAGIFVPLAKAVYRPRTADEAGAAVADAIRTALSWPRGPVYVDIPTDVLDRPLGPIEVPAPARLSPASPQVERLAALLGDDGDGAVIWAGGGVVQSGAEAELLALAERLDAPVVTTYAARGVLPAGHPLLVGLPPHEPEVAELIGTAGLLLALGTDFDGMMTRNWRMPLPGRLAAVNCAEEDLAKNLTPDVAVLGDVRTVLTELLGVLKPRRRETAPRLTALREAVRGRLAADPRTAEAMRFLASVESAVGDETVIVCDMAIPGYWYGGYGRVAGGRLLQYPVGWGTLGYALPASIGPATDGRPALVIAGDGGLMFALGEFMTLAERRLPVTVLVLDDGGYGMLRYDQEVAGDQIRGTDLRNPDWERLGEAFGVPPAVVDGVGEALARALTEALADPGPRLVVARAALTPPKTTSPRWFE
ncbi:thiamine pyrophosphate-binding protein [Actinoallomurus iriomotensis]|uniref:Acetolactate synthase I/II/III large subunit n=1 Tax=Actinoallomurus iriomotensis TaxID=478107 RepID=A0A9W6S1K4_9ACTN|nr:thiamine pyrophosphate-binding protein [Actinoallomurus iriomotensis]GLY85563.1 acetolactate synthase I/II/III large subunit [Actinoallomurus iriomotensis]